jgi:transcriptional regulator with XRE-family HTH domain
MGNTFTLREWRHLKEVSMRNMADACGVHENTYRHWERKPEMIPMGAAQKLAKFLGVEITSINFSPTVCR